MGPGDGTVTCYCAEVKTESVRPFQSMKNAWFDRELTKLEPNIIFPGIETEILDPNGFS